MLKNIGYKKQIESGSTDIFMTIERGRVVELGRTDDGSEEDVTVFAQAMSCGRLVYQQMISYMSSVVSWVLSLLICLIVSCQQTEHHTVGLPDFAVPPLISSS